MLDLEIINEAVRIIRESEEKGRTFTDKEKHFITEYAFKTGDIELVAGLVTNMAKEKEDDETLMGRFGVLLGEKEAWITQLENLLVALEMYRIEEEKALNRITFILKVCGFDVSVENIKDKKVEEIKKIVKRELAI